MGLFDSLFGKNKTYSQVQKPLSKEVILRLISRTRINTLDSHEETEVEQALLAARKGDGKISLYEIEKLLHTMARDNRISENDRLALMRACVQYFNEGHV